MHSTLATLIDRLDDPAIAKTGIIPWGAPVPSFGDLARSTVATVGLNPSNREFVDENGRELDGPERRFHTLQSLGLVSWENAEAKHLRLILDSCRNYFLCNPYDRWFKRLDFIVSGTGTSFYDTLNTACHLDIIPYATSRKWTELSFQQRSKLLSLGRNVLALLLRDSPVRVLLLNGKSVVEYFQTITGVHLESYPMKRWTLPRRTKPDISGFAYQGTLNSLCGVSLSRKILVLGYNHNIQSSFGVTSNVVVAIQKWIAHQINKTALP